LDAVTRLGNCTLRLEHTERGRGYETLGVTCLEEIIEIGRDPYSFDTDNDKGRLYAMTPESRFLCEFDREG
jgi:hypothetical protein